MRKKGRKLNINIWVNARRGGEGGHGPHEQKTEEP